MTKKKPPSNPVPKTVTVQNCAFAGVKFDANVTALLSDVVHVLQTAAGAARETIQLFTGINHSNEAMLKIVKADEEHALIANCTAIDNAKKKA